MKLTKKEIKQRYFDKVYKNAPMVLCACGCGKLIKSKDKYGRDKKYINGHNNRKYDDPKQYKREWNYRNRPAKQTSKKQRAHKFKRELVIMAGGKCSLCGLPFDGECTALFDFHHRKPEEKLYSINIGSINHHSKEKIMNEVKKCDLLCANCHRLLHWDWNNTINTAGLQ